MTIAIYSHSDCLKHDTGPWHPENARRLRAILEALRNCDFSDGLNFVDAPKGTDELIRLAHTQDYLNKIKDSSPASGYKFLDEGDTVMSSGSLNAAYRGVGASCAAVEAILSNEYSSAFCAIRPPGHHAEKARAMGFCIFNNIAIAALHALENKNLKRVAFMAMVHRILCRQTRASCISPLIKAHFIPVQAVQRNVVFQGIL